MRWPWHYWSDGQERQRERNATSIDDGHDGEIVASEIIINGLLNGGGGGSSDSGKKKKVRRQQQRRWE